MCLEAKLKFVNRLNLPLQLHWCGKMYSGCTLPYLSVLKLNACVWNTQFASVIPANILLSDKLGLFIFCRQLEDHHFDDCLVSPKYFTSIICMTSINSSSISLEKRGLPSNFVRIASSGFFPACLRNYIFGTLNSFPFYKPPCYFCRQL